MHILNRFTLRTPESVELDFTLAGIGNRALALCIDYPLWLLIMSGFIFLWSFLSSQLLDIIVELTGNADAVELWLAAIALLLFFVIYVGYFVLFETLWQGQTPGKRIANIRVIRDDGRPVGLAQTTLRALLRPIDDFFLGAVGAVFILFSKREKRLGDYLAGTLVVVDEQTPISATIILSDPAYEMAKTLPAIADVSRLLPDDFAIVRDYLQRRTAMTQKAKDQVSLQLARQVRVAIALRDLPEGTRPDMFLEAVYLAYQKDR